MKIDFIFFNNFIENLESHVVGKDTSASDHRPVFMRFRIKE